MAAGVGRVLVTTIINIIVVLIIVAIIMSTIFVIQADTYLKGVAREMYQLRARQLQESMARAGAPPEKIKEQLQKLNLSIWESLGLTKPLYQRVLLYAWNAIIFNFSAFPLSPGVRYPGGGHNAGEVVMNALKATVILFTTATVIELLIAIFLGLQTAKRAGSLLDKTVVGIALLSTSLPMWWVGILMLLVFSYYLHWFPFAAKEVYVALARLNPNSPYYIFNYIETWLYYMTLPLITIVLVTFGGASYIVRNIVLGTLREDFVMVARAKGLPERLVLYKHVLRAASPPIATMTALSLIGSLGGAIITETVFQWPGMGLTYWIAINNGDTGVVMANTWITTFLFIVVIFLLDFIYMLLDPRVRVGRRQT